MKNFIIAPDSFKGTASATEICNIGKRAILRHIPHANISLLPIADGGEGTIDCFLAAIGGERIALNVTGPDFSPVCAEYAIIDGDTAVIELASAAGLPLMGNAKNPATSTTFGVGELILDAISRGVSKIAIGLGGSATNDAACGLATALGARFFNGDGDEFIPTGATLGEIEDIDISDISALLDGIDITVMYDVDNPLYGPRGAACIFSPQKGADEDMVRMLDMNLIKFANTVNNTLGKDISEIEGAGAAGGAGGGCVAFLGATLKPGIETVLNICNFSSLAKDADLIITGEGRIDNQTAGGKAISGIARSASSLGVPVAVIAGDIGSDMDEMYQMGVSFILSTNRVAKNFADIKHRAKDDLELTFDTLARIITTLK